MKYMVTSYANIMTETKHIGKPHANIGLTFIDVIGKFTISSSNPNRPKGESLGGMVTTTDISSPNLAPPMTRISLTINVSVDSTIVSSIIVISI